MWLRFDRSIPNQFCLLNFYRPIGRDFCLLIESAADLQPDQVLPTIQKIQGLRQTFFHCNDQPLTGGSLCIRGKLLRIKRLENWVHIHFIRQMGFCKMLKEPTSNIEIDVADNCSRSGGWLLNWINVLVAPMVPPSFCKVFLHTSFFMT